MRRGWMLALVLLGAGCTDWAGYDLDVALGKVSFLSTMRRSVALDPYEAPRAAPEGSVPFATPAGDVPPPFGQTQLDSVGRVLRNPYAPTPALLVRGKHVYETYCAVCHGPTGAGNGPVVGPNKFPYAPAINGPTTAARSDGYLYAIVRVGRGLMPAYGHIPHEDRWAVVLYIRELQRAAGAPVAAAAAATPATATTNR